MTYTQISDAVIPSVYAQYQQMMTEVKSALVRSGVLARDTRIDTLLAGGGNTFNVPKWNDLADTLANISAGAAGSAVTPLNITSLTEIGVRLSRNQAWGSADLVASLAGDDPQAAMASLTAGYWERQLQLALIAIATGVFADNTANDSADYTSDISGAGFVDGVTTFSAEAFIDALGTIGDSDSDLGVVAMHSVVYNKARKNNLIEFIPDSTNAAAAAIPTFLGRRVIVHDGMPKSGSVYETYIMGAGAFRWGVSTPKHAVEVYRLPLDASGGGTEALITRVEWCLHPNGHAYVGAATGGGPANTVLDDAASWNRVVAERKQAKIARLITREA